MGAQKGRDLLLKVDAAGDGTFTTVAGLRARKLSFNAEPVDATDADSAGTLARTPRRRGRAAPAISGSGLFRDAASDAILRGLFFGDVLRTWQVAIPDFGIVSGPFEITALEYGGEHDGEVTFDIALESAGALSFSEV